MGIKVKMPKVLCYNYHNGITDEEEDIIFAIELKLFYLCTISLPNTFQSIRTSKSNHKNNRTKNGSTKLSNTQFVSVDGKIVNIYDQVVAFKKWFI